MTDYGETVAQVGVTSLVFTGVASPVVWVLLRRWQLMDVPSGRSSHLLATPRGGGLACLIGVGLAVGLAPGLSVDHKLLLIVSTGSFAGLGFVDDLRHLPVVTRLIIQFGLATVASYWAINPAWPIPIVTALLGLVGVLWIAGYVNVFNFMDGINGLAGAAAAVAGVTFVLIGVRREDLPLTVGGAGLVGAAFGFLPWNFPQARFFLGDIGSYLFGSVTAILVVVGFRAHVPLEALIGPEAIFVADAAWTLERRIARGDDWAAAHREHVYQRLHQRGWSHSRTTVFVTMAMVVVAALGALSLTGSTTARVFGDLIALAVVAGYLASPSHLPSPKPASL